MPCFAKKLEYESHYKEYENFDLNMFGDLAADFARIRLEASVESHVPEFLNKNHG